MTHSVDVNELLTALAKAQGAFVPALKDDSATINSAKGNYSYAFAPLSSVMAACRGPLAANGLAVVQSPETVADGVVGITTFLGHSSGQWMRSVLELAYDPRSAHALGSAVTYGRRYALKGMLGLVDDDDDGAAAMPVQPATNGHVQVNGNGNGHPKPAGEPLRGPAPDSNPYETPAPAPASKERERGSWGNGQGQTSGTTAPRSGRALFAWLKELEQKHEVELIKYLNSWAKLQDYPGRMVDWTNDQVKFGHAEAVRKLQSLQSRGDAYEEALAN